MIRSVQQNLAKVIFFLALSSVIGAFFINYLYRQEVERGRAAVSNIPQVYVNFSPDHITSGSGSTFSTTMEAAPTANFYTSGYDYYIKFDNQKAIVTNIGYKLGSGLGDSNDPASLQRVNQSGIIHLQGGQFPDTGYLMVANVPVVVGSITFQSTSAAESAVYIDNTQGHAFTDNNTGNQYGVLGNFAFVNYPAPSPVAGKVNINLWQHTMGDWPPNGTRVSVVELWDATGTTQLEKYAPPAPFDVLNQSNFPQSLFHTFNYSCTNGTYFMVKIFYNYPYDNVVGDYMYSEGGFLCEDVPNIIIPMPVVTPTATPSPTTGAVTSPTPTPQISMVFEPDRLMTQVGATFSATMKASSSVTFNTSGYDYTLTFDKTKMALEHIGYLLGDRAGTGDSDTNLDAVNAAGVIHIQGAALPDAGTPMPADTPVGVASLVFRSTSTDLSLVQMGQAGQPNIFTDNMTGAVYDIQSGNLGVNCDPRLIGCQPGPVSITPSVSPSPTGGAGNTTFNVTVRLQGIPKTPLQPRALPFRFKFKNNMDNSIISTTATLNIDSSTDTGLFKGTFKVDLPASASTSQRFSVYVKGPFHLQKRICDIIPAEASPGSYFCSSDKMDLNTGGTNTLDFSGVMLLAGDLPVSALTSVTDANGQNGVIDSEDTSYLRSHFGSTDADVLNRADLNLDGSVDSQDYSLVIFALGIKYDDPIEGQ